MDAATAIVVSIILVIIVVSALAFGISRREKWSRPTGLIFDKDGNILWPEGVGQPEPRPRQFSNPEIDIMRAEIRDERPGGAGTSSRSTWVDGGVNLRPEPETKWKVWDEPEELEQPPSFKMHRFQCEVCGGDLNVERGSNLAECEHCGITYYLENFEPGQDEYRWTEYTRQPYFLEDGWKRPHDF